MCHYSFWNLTKPSTFQTDISGLTILSIQSLYLSRYIVHNLHKYLPTQKILFGSFLIQQFYVSLLFLESYQTLYISNRYLRSHNFVYPISISFPITHYTISICNPNCSFTHTHWTHLIIINLFPF